MIISKTPYRISFCGGGTDYLEYFLGNPGIVVGTTIDKYCFLLAKKSPPGSKYFSRIVHKTVEEVPSNEMIHHPGFKAALRQLDLSETALDISHISDLPAQCGLGTSSAFMVGLVNALSKLIYDREPEPTILAQTAFAVEKHAMKENVGIQDQFFAAFGGLNIIELNDKEVRVSTLGISRQQKEELHSHILLLQTNQSRWSSEVVSSYVNRLALDKRRHNQALFRITHKAIDAILSGNYEKLGDSIHRNWMLKRDLSSAVSNRNIDEWYDNAIQAGAFGGKILGGGGGGTLMIIAAPENHKDIIKVTGLNSIPFQFSEAGSQIIHG